MIIFHLAVWPEEPREIHFFEKSFRNLGPDRPKINENGLELGRREAPRAHIRREWSHWLSDASGHPPDAI